LEIHSIAPPASMKNHANPLSTATSAASSTWTNPVAAYLDTCEPASHYRCRQAGFPEESRQRVNLASGAIVKSIWRSAKIQGVPFFFCAQFSP
jgi:hypothetical protein